MKSSPERQHEFDIAYMKMAIAMSELSYAIRKKVGSIIVSKNDQVISQGFSLQHFKTDFSWNFNKTNEERELILKNIKERDAKKFEICKQKNIQLIYYSNLHINFPYKVITNINKIKKILEECLKKNQISTI